MATVADSQAEKGAVRVPMPSLRYGYYRGRPDPVGVVPEPGSPRVHSVSEVTVSLWRDGLRVTVLGPLLKRDGTAGRHQRCCMVDLGQPQPHWLAALVADARNRLTPPGTTTGGEDRG